jgi:hypothetical protein
VARAFTRGEGRERQPRDEDEQGDARAKTLTRAPKPPSPHAVGIVTALDGLEVFHGEDAG